MEYSRLDLKISRSDIVSKSSRHSAVSVKLSSPRSFTETAECLDDFETSSDSKQEQVTPVYFATTKETFRVS